MSFFDISNAPFELMGMPVSYLEIVSTILALIAVILMAMRNMLTYPIGIVASVLTGILLYKFYFYANMVEYFYYVGANVYGWILWKSAPKDEANHVDVQFSSRNTILKCIGLMIIVSVMFGIFMSNIHTLLPKYFPEPAAYPFPDAFTTVFAFYAMWVQIKRRIESWIIWIVIDAVYIVMYILKGLPLYSILMFIYLIIAALGLYSWMKATKNHNRVTNV